MEVLVGGDIVLSGTVGEGLFGDGFTLNDVARALAKVGRSTAVNVRINSGGGYADEGVAIYNALASHGGKVTTYIEGVAASAASLIAMAGSTVVMRRGSTLMIHDPGSLTIGNAEHHAKSIEALEAQAQGMAAIYATKSGKTVAQARAAMKAETWLEAEQAVAEGYADRLEAANSNEPAAFPYATYAHAPGRMVAMATARGWRAVAGGRGDPFAKYPASLRPEAVVKKFLRAGQ
jgi:ATP-dependent protease ClpP protease subunit